jgi:glutamine amidotransferase
MRQDIVIIDSGSGNLRSVEKALERAARERGLAARIAVEADPAKVAAADRIVLPGVGAFAAGMAGLNAVDGLVAALEHAVLAAKRPFLGICVGMQLLAGRGLEYGRTPGLGWIAGEVRRLEPADPALRVPHTGWNGVRLTRPHPALASLGAGPADFYFIHSYRFDAENAADVLGVTDYGGEFAAIVGRDNILACQFHPEKSQAAGLALIGDFLEWRP